MKQHHTALLLVLPLALSLAACGGVKDDTQSTPSPTVTTTRAMPPSTPSPTPTFESDSQASGLLEIASQLGCTGRQKLDPGYVADFGDGTAYCKPPGSTDGIFFIEYDSATDAESAVASGAVELGDSVGYVWQNVVILVPANDSASLAKAAAAATPVGN